jgi:hypothetical protein
MLAKSLFIQVSDVEHLRMHSADFDNLSKHTFNGIWRVHWNSKLGQLGKT